MSANLITADPALVILLGGSDVAATYTLPQGKLVSSDVWLQFIVAAAHTGVYSFFASLNGTNLTQLTLPAALLVHSTAAGGTAVLTGNTIVTTGFSGSFMLCLQGCPRYLEIRGTRSAGGSATNLTVLASASGIGAGY